MSCVSKKMIIGSHFLSEMLTFPVLASTLISETVPHFLHRCSCWILATNLSCCCKSSIWAKQTELMWITAGVSGCFLIVALFFIMKEYDKEYEQVKQL